MTAIIIVGRFEYRPATPTPQQPATAFEKRFDGRPGCAFSAINDAEAFLAARGFSYGPGCAASRKSAVMFGRNWTIAKWRNLTPLEQRRSHGALEGDRRDGPIILRIFFSAPVLAVAAVASPETADAIISVRDGQR
ncbi:hypothetical protein [Bradyrhizobium sp. RT9a]|uniref:hypothetical protein n=1 Tax=Bradyrhizobium sp. RT9a TaxID=3156384 RepID=UPI00339A7603